MIAKTPGAHGSMLLWGVSAAVAIAALLAWWLPSRGAAHGGQDAVAQTGVARGAASRTTRSASAHASLQPAPREPAQAVSGNGPDDLATYFQPGDPEPTGAEVIEALQHAGVRTGLGAFNPPGTSPPLIGLAVPEDYDLPEGYVRHHQVTDEGVPIEPILMFSPDVTLHDARGRPIAMPADRVVPPALAPPGLPLRRIQMPSR